VTINKQHLVFTAARAAAPWREARQVDANAVEERNLHERLAIQIEVLLRNRPTKSDCSAS
jgi:hypothetical protein